jgi:hypothetical protein
MTSRSGLAWSARLECSGLQLAGRIMLKQVLAVLTLLVSFNVYAGDAPPPSWAESKIQTGPAAPPADMAQITLIEPINKIQGLFPYATCELTGDTRKLVAVTSWRSKTVLLPPGKHLLLATPGGIGHALEVNVAAGKRYYVLLRFIYANGMQLRPLRPTGTSDYRVDSKDFPKWMKTTRWVEMTPEAESYFTKFDETIAKGQAGAIVEWQAKSAAEAAELTLNAEDAVPL